MMPAPIIPINNRLLDAALAYAAIGWHILPLWWVETDEEGRTRCACGNPVCKNPGKHPIAKAAPWGQNNATTDADLIRHWWQEWPQAHIAVYLEPSGLCAIDIDPRNGGFQTMEMLEADHGSLASDLTQYTGGGGEHRVFQKPANNGSLPGKLGAGVDLKLNGYIVCAPSGHMSGGEYDWEASSDPRDGVLPSPLPDWLRDLSAQRSARSAAVDEGDAAGRFIAITPAQQQELQQALEAIPSDDRDTWLQVGMALQSTGGSQWAFGLWDAWSRQSAKYDPVDQIRVWRSLSGRGLDGITYRSIFELAKQQGVTVAPVIELPPAIEVDFSEMLASAESGAPVDALDGATIRTVDSVNVPEVLLRPPGILGEITDYINATSRKPQPQFAVQASIAFACTVLGRRFRTNMLNWPSLYLLNVGKSASGKEWAKTIIEKMLEACNLDHLIGPASYTSSAGVICTLQDQPSHITIIDEFHRELEKASVRENANAKGMIKTLIEVWGRNEGVLRPQGYSTNGLGRRDSGGGSISERSVRNPALTLLGMAVPEFWEQIGSSAARDGFLNRFLIVESTQGRQVGNHVPVTDVPQVIIDWATEIRARYDGIVCPDTNHSAQPDPQIVPFTEQAAALFRAFEHECVELMDKYERHGLAEMFGRTNEIAMKLSMVLALGRGDTAIKEADASWSILYARTYAEQTVLRLISTVADSQFEAAKKQVSHYLATCGADGATPSQIDRSCTRFKAMTKRQQIELLQSLEYLGSVKHVRIQRGGAGRPSERWVAVESEEGN